MTIKVLVADDQQLVRTGFTMIINAQDDMRIVAEADNGSQAIEAARRTRPHVVLMDIRMPTTDGITATRHIVTAGLDPQPRVVILTTYDLDEYVFDALTAGASGFLLKDVPPEDLVKSVRVAASGEALLAPTITRRLIEEFAAVHTPAANATVLDGLTPREVDVIKLLAQGMSNAEIASTLIIGESTVKTHLGHALDKLQLRDRVQAVILAYETGLVRPGAKNNRPNLAPFRDTI